MIEPLVLLLAALPTGLPTPAELQEEIVKARMAIRQGTITMRVEGRGLDWHDERPIDFDFDFVFDFDGDRIRFDKTQTDLGGSLVGRWSFVLDPSSFVDFYEGIDSHQEPPRVHMGEIAWMSGPAPVFHPRVIGVNTRDIDAMSAVTLEMYFRRTNNISEEVYDDQLDGKEVYRLEIQTGLSNNLGIKYWIDPSEGYAIRRIETSHNSGVPFEGIFEASYRQWPNNDTWFLHDGTLTQSRNDNPIYTERVHIVDARFGLVPDPHRFEIESFSMPAGTTVQRNSQRLVWDGAALVSEVDDVPTRALSNSTWIWIKHPKFWIAAISSSLVVLLALQYWRRRGLA